MGSVNDEHSNILLMLFKWKVNVDSISRMENIRIWTQIAEKGKWTAFVEHFSNLIDHSKHFTLPAAYTHIHTGHFDCIDKALSLSTRTHQVVFKNLFSVLPKDSSSCEELEIESSTFILVDNPL